MPHASPFVPADREVVCQPLSAGEWLEGSAWRAPCAALTPLLDRLLALPILDRLYRSLPKDGRPFPDRALEALDVAIDVADDDVAKIPQAGPLTIVANHPFGALDGLALLSVASRVRPDVRLIGNALLARIPELRPSTFFVDPFGQQSSVAGNAATLRTARRWIEGGGALAAFPAGEVSHVILPGGRIVDREWSPATIALAMNAGAPIVPFFFDGTNSRWFHLAGRVHPRLRTALLVREMLARRGGRVALTIGTPLWPSELERLERRSRASYVRARTYAIGRGAAIPATSSCDGRSVRPAPAVRQIAAAGSAAAIAREIDGLHEEHILVRSGDFLVGIAGGSELPRTLREIGRLRETAFRAVGEGSGRELDLDRYDAHYQHLFVWNRERHEIVGAYRAGQTDVILPREGLSGLYTSTLFEYDRSLMTEIGPALELGRAFVRPEYQRDYSPLLLLWKGIGTFVARHPRYRVLFGTVSISSDYQSLSQQILARFLMATTFRPDLARRVRARNPPPFLRSNRADSPLAGVVARTIAEVGSIVAGIETDGKGVPVLLRQYLKLNARLLGFNVDAAFGGVLDGLMMVDLADVSREILTRYMGKSGAQSFLARHAPDIDRRAS